ncbi:MAG: hypothetical protein WCW13_05090 [archaeon]|jgi:hypothetical protein
MVFSIIFHPTKTFETALEVANVSKALIIVLLSGLFFGLAAFFLTAQLVPAIYLFIFAIVQWLVYSAIVWFFEFVHVRKRKKMVGTSFTQCACVVGELWKINLISSILAAFVAFIFPFSSDALLLVVGSIFMIIIVILVIAWIVASFKMLKVLVGVHKWKLVINWAIINLLNLMIIGFISSLVNLLI